MLYRIDGRLGLLSLLKMYGSPVFNEGAMIEKVFR